MIYFRNSALCFPLFALSSLRPGKVSAALAGSELRYSSLRETRLALHFGVFWLGHSDIASDEDCLQTSEHGTYCTAEAAGFATCLSLRQIT